MKDEGFAFKNISVALKKFQDAAYELDQAFSQVDEGKLNEFITEDYPFKKDYETTSWDIYEWCKGARNRIDNAYSKEVR